jgi:hypothetical protein
MATIGRLMKNVAMDQGVKHEPRRVSPKRRGRGIALLVGVL